MRSQDLDSASTARSDDGHGPVENKSTQESVESVGWPIDCAGKSRDRSYASCLTAKPPMHHRRVLVWLWRLVAAGRTPRPFGLPAFTPPLSTSAATTALKKPLFWAGFRLECFCRFSHYAGVLGPS